MDWSSIFSQRFFFIVYLFTTVAILLLQDVVSMEDLSPISYQKSLQQVDARQAPVCNLCSGFNSNRQSPVMLRGNAFENNVNSQLQFFTSNLPNKDYTTLLEIHQHIRMRCQDFDCLLNTLKEEGTKVLAKTASCSAIFGGKIPLSVRDLTDLVKSKIDSIESFNNFNSQLDRCSRQATDAINQLKSGSSRPRGRNGPRFKAVVSSLLGRWGRQNDVDNDNNDAQTGSNNNNDAQVASEKIDEEKIDNPQLKIGLEAIAKLATKMKELTGKIKVVLDIYEKCSEQFSFPDRIDGSSKTIVDNIKSCFDEIKDKKDDLPKKLETSITDIDNFVLAIKKLITILSDLPSNLEELSPKLNEITNSITQINNLANLPVKLKEKVKKTLTTIKEYVEITSKFVEVVISDMKKPGVQGVQDKLDQIAETAKVVTTTQSVPKNIVTIAKTTLEYIPKIKNLINIFSEFPEGLNEVKTKITEIEKALKDVQDIKKLPAKVKDIITEVGKFIPIANQGVEVFDTCSEVVKQITNNEHINFESLKTIVGKLQKCHDSMKEVKFIDQEKKKTGGGFVDENLRKLEELKGKISEKSDKFFDLIDILKVCETSVEDPSFNNFQKCHEKLNNGGVLRDKLNNFLGVVKLGLDICKSCENVFELDFKIETLVSNAKNKMKEVASCLNNVEEGADKLGTFSKKLKPKIEKVKKFIDKYLKKGPMAIFSAMTSCTEVVKKGDELQATIKDDYDFGKFYKNNDENVDVNFHEFLDNAHEMVEDAIEKGKADVETIKEQYNQLIEASTKCYDSMKGVMEMVPEGWDIKKRITGNTITKKAIDATRKGVQRTRNFLSKAMRWGKKLAQAAVPVLKKASQVAGKMFKLAGAILAPLTECIAKIHIDTEASYKDKWLNCYVAACQEFDNVAIAVGASFAGMAAASPACAAGAGALMTLTPIAAAGGGTICMLAASAVAAEAADLAYRGTNMDKKANELCEATRGSINTATDKVMDAVKNLNLQQRIKNIGGAGAVDDALITKVDTLMEGISDTSHLNKQRKELDLGDCVKIPDAGSGVLWKSCDDSTHCMPDPDNPCEGRCICDTTWDNTCECVHATAQ
jgi:methyl-accepting chemotaxis protein